MAAGGAEGNRTPDLCSAIAALSHLSYSPAPSVVTGRPIEIGPGTGSLAASFPPCNRLSREAVGLPIWLYRTRNSTGTAPVAVRFSWWVKAGIRPARLRPFRRTIMAYERYGSRDLPRDERSRWQEGSEGRERGGREDRGFFERAGDEVASWFGDEEAERRRREDQRMREHEHERGYGREWRGEERGRFTGAGRERSQRERAEEFRSP